jgi:hypothetical protein
MARTDAPTEFDWTPVVGKALAFLCLHYADMRDKRVGEQAEFLSRLGVPRAAAAELLGTSDESLRVLASQRVKRGSGRSKSTVKRSTANRSTSKKTTTAKRSTLAGKQSKATGRRGSRGGR